MRLSLADGSVYAGRSFGANREAVGEVVFYTGMVGYVETLTDPSYRGQILILTYPLQGNYGVPAPPFQSERIQVQGLVVHQYAAAYSHHRAVRSLSDWLKSEGIPAITGVDTRALTKHLRAHGTIQGRLSFEAPAHGDAAEPLDMKQVVAAVVRPEITVYPGGNQKILVIDTGIKQSIIDALCSRGAHVVRVPFYAPWEERLEQSETIDGVVIGNGPGDPTDLPELVARLRGLLHRQIPLFGICLGHQLLALAAGASTYKLPYGHRAANQPVKDLLSRRCYMTSQNHGYAVSQSSLPSGFTPWMRNLNDGTNEGIRHDRAPFFSVQFHPEGTAGPHDTAFLFDDFLRVVAQAKLARETTQ